MRLVGKGFPRRGNFPISLGSLNSYDKYVNLTGGSRPDHLIDFTLGKEDSLIKTLTFLICKFLEIFFNKNPKLSIFLSEEAKKFLRVSRAERFAFDITFSTLRLCCCFGFLLPPLSGSLPPYLPMEQILPAVRRKLIKYRHGAILFVKDVVT